MKGDHYRTTEFIKSRNTFKSNDGTKLYKSNDKYYTTYEIKRNKQISYLSNQKTDETIYKDLMENTLNKDLKLYLKKKNRPYVICNEAYHEIIESIKYN